MGHLEAISALRKLCNAQGLCGELPGSGEGGPPTREEKSGKLSALTCLLLAIAQAGQEKVVVVSFSMAALDLIQQQVKTININNPFAPIQALFKSLYPPCSSFQFPCMSLLSYI